MDALVALMKSWPLGSALSVVRDGFNGQVIGYYFTREGKPGLVLQQNGTKVVHVYGEKWFIRDQESR